MGRARLRSRLQGRQPREFRARGHAGVRPADASDLTILLALVALAAAPVAPDIAVVEWQGKKVCEVLMEASEVRISRCTLPAGATHLCHRHMTRFIYRLSDGAERTTDAKGTRDSASRAGEYGVSPALDWHQVLNAGSSELRYLIVDLKYRDRAAKP